jgi:DNA-binding FadR family transcriptional regulator
MPFQPIVSQRLYQQVAGQIGELIRAGQFPAGHRLPPERDLAKSLGASRPVVREAMIALEIAGLVEVRGGSGAYVKAPSEWVANRIQGGLMQVLTDAGPSPFDVIAARLLIEGETVFAAASEATKADLEGIAETITMMRSAIAFGEPSEKIDRLFHTRIAAATHNTVLPPIVESLWDGQFAPVFTALSTRTHLPQNRAATLRDHSRIADALLAHDAIEARTAMRAHLGEVLRVLMRDDDVEVGTSP